VGLFPPFQIEVRLKRSKRDQETSKKQKRIKKESKKKQKRSKKEAFGIVGSEK
jgi:hypothetical protein